MLTFLEKELRKIEAEKIIEPEAEIDLNKDHVVGSMSSDVRKLYQLQFDLHAQEIKISNSLVRDSQTDYIDPKFLLARQKELRSVSKKSEVVSTMMLVSIRDQYDLWDKPEVGVRKGWQVVWSELSEEKQLELDSDLNEILEVIKGQDRKSRSKIN